MTCKHSRAATVSLILATVGSFVTSPLKAQDRIVPIKGAAAIGKIGEIQRDQVTINVRGKDQPPYKTNEISKIVFDDEPSNLDRARDFISGGQFNLAEAELNKIDVSKINDPRIANDVQFYKGYAAARLSLSGMGDPKAAAATLVAFAKAAPDSHHAYKAAELLGDLAMALNRPEMATKYYGELSAAPFPELKALAVYKQGEVKLSENDSPAARALFQRLTEVNATDAETTRLKNLGEVGLAICDARDGKSQEALTKLQELVKKHDSSDQVLFARIYNAMGMCYQALGQTQQALLAYLRTDLLFSSSPDLHAEALYQLTKLWPDVGQPQRSTEARQRLTSRYPSSPWNNKK
jgi:tetratricopeptide (TPR) repeat protein